MSSSSPAPKLPMWVFFATDAALLAAAIWIAKQSRHPMPELTSAAIVACIVAGAIAALVPLVVYYERQKNESLDDRQRALEALARTVASSAEQISIAAGGLHEIADIAQKNLKQAEVLPHKLQEKIAEFQAQLANANDTDREELEHELEELRGSETERLQSLADRIARTTGEFAKLESTTHQHLIAANEAVSKLSFGTASAIGKAQAAAELALAQARQEAARNLGETEGTAIKAIEAAKAAAAADLTAQFENSILQLRETTAQVASLIETLQTAARTAAAVTRAPATIATDHGISSESPGTSTATEQNKATTDVASPSSASAAAEPAPFPAPAKRTRKPRREEHSPVAPAEGTSAPESSVATATPEANASAEATHPDTPLDAAPSSANTEFPTEAAAPTSAEPSPASTVTPDPVRSAQLAPDAAPVASESAEPPSPAEVQSMPEAAPSQETAGPNGAIATAAESAFHPGEPGMDLAKPARKRAAKRTEDDQPGLGLELHDASGQGEGGSTVESVLSSDGATRVVVTAYIGIGNRLFIRGSGPGLSWKKGVPLQFVSIGKWRWETNDASAPVQFKLLKNDEQESASLGTLTIEPSHQQEVTANFG